MQRRKIVELVSTSMFLSASYIDALRYNIRKAEVSITNIVCSANAELFALPVSVDRAASAFWDR